MKKDSKAPAEMLEHSPGFNKTDHKRLFITHNDQQVLQSLGSSSDAFYVII